MRPVIVPVLVALVASLVFTACAPATPPAPTKAPEAPKAAEPAKAPAAQPTAAPAAPAAAPAPTAAPAAAPAPTAALPAAPTPAAAPAKKVDFPAKDKQITIIVPYAAGASSDAGARLLADALEKEMGVKFLVVNKEGALAQVGLTELARSKPDGYTMALTNLPGALDTYMDPERKAIYSRKDLQQVALQVVDPIAVEVKADSPFKTFKDLIDDAKAKPGELRAAITGIVPPPLMIEKAAGVKFTVVLLDGAAQLNPALLGGHVNVGIQTIGSAGAAVKAGQARLLGVMDTVRSESFPDVPRLDEQGYKLYYGSSRGYSVPAGTPKEVVDILSGAIKKVMDSAEVKQKMKSMDLPARYMDPVQYTAYWDELESQYKPLMDEWKKRQQ